MNNLSRYPHCKLGKRYSETINIEIIDRHAEYKLPRHISSLKIKSHRGEQYPTLNRNSDSLPTFNQPNDVTHQRVAISSLHSLRRAKATLFSFRYLIF